MIIPLFHAEKLTLIIGIVPSHWIKYKVLKNMTLLQWITDFKKRLDQIAAICRQSRGGAGESGGSIMGLKNVWLGGLFSPEAYITATRQDVAQRNRWSLEELRLEVAVDVLAKENEFVLTGMYNVFLSCFRL